MMGTEQQVRIGDERGGSSIPLELLAPAGGFEQLQAAIAFGADAVYLAADRFGMRARAANFSLDELPRAVGVAHDAGVKVHLTCNVLMMQDDLPQLPTFFEAVAAAGVDALIIGDMGAFALARQYAPRCELHVSTQASVANAETAKLWHSMGAARIVCAREMTLANIAEMRKQIPADLQIEAFAHGAQCMAVSGRCLISAYLNGRSGNRGHCSQPCRWNYVLEEEKRSGVYFPIDEDERGSYLMNAKDLCMIEHLRELAAAGVDSIKIEGRNKKAYYVACVVGAYRRALDGVAPEGLMSELTAVSHRPFSTGFYFGNPQQAHDKDGYDHDTVHVADALVCEPHGEGFRLTLRCRNRFEEREQLEVVSPGESVRAFDVHNLTWIPEPDEAFAGAEEAVPIANRSCNIYRTECPFAVAPGSFIRARR